MPHAYYTIDCKVCTQSYCVVCNEKCKSCDNPPDLTEKTQDEIARMRKYVSNRFPGH